MSRLMWAEIVQRYPWEWMMLAETEADDAGTSRSRAYSTTTAPR